MRAFHYIYLFLIISFCFASCNISVNKTIYINDGETVRSSLNTVNGGVIIGSNCNIYGNCRSVNGGIEVGNNSRVEELQTVNGRIDLARNVIVYGDVESVNGSVGCVAGVNIKGKICTINGSIDLTNSTVERDLLTYNGNITLLNKSIIEGDIIIKRNKVGSHHNGRLKIRIEEESVVQGDIIVRDEERDVKVYLSGGGKVNGRIRNADIIKEYL